MTISAEIRSALDDGSIFVEYLPTVTVKDAFCVGGEALVRWKRKRAVLSAAAFIPLIENTPLSGSLTYWVFDTVASELADWLGAHPDAHISINVPPEILGRGGLEYAARRSGLQARLNQIILEITERGVPDRLGLDALNQCAGHGVRLALDDTMMSGANLALLTRCNFGMIKLDRTLIAELKSDRPQPAWVSGLESLLHTSTSLQVIAEGVETDYQAKRLIEAGVQMAQGHLYSTALKARDFMQFYAEHRVGLSQGYKLSQEHRD